MDEGTKDRIHRLADLSLSQADEILSIGTDTMPLYMGHMERVLFLDGATLTLSFTVVTALGAHFSVNHPALHLPALVWSWRLLVIAMLACVYHNAVGINSIVHGKMWGKLMVAQVTTKRLEIAAAQEDTSAGFQEQINLSRNALLRTVRHCKYAYNAAHGVTLLAFIFLLHFVTINVQAAFGR